GTGLAAVLGPLRQRLAAPGRAPLWLIHGERLVVPAPLRALQESAPPRLRVDALLSRGPEPLRLPEWLDRHRATLGDFVAQGATIHVCGSRAPGAAVLEALDAILPQGTGPLHDQGRLLTDLY
ncbi:hypothetical protein E0K89_022120, partial [Aquicoccus sp. SCR17]|nr:hypothetical protein [Carideicomes alvinocaridis]